MKITQLKTAFTLFNIEIDTLEDYECFMEIMRIANVASGPYSPEEGMTTRILDTVRGMNAATD